MSKLDSYIVLLADLMLTDQERDLNEAEIATLGDFEKSIYWEAPQYIRETIRDTHRRKIIFDQIDASPLGDMIRSALRLSQEDKERGEAMLAELYQHLGEELKSHLQEKTRS